MKSRPLLLSAQAQKEIGALIAHAKANPINIHEIFRIIGGNRPPPGDDPKNVIVIPVGYRVVFTIEQHQCGWCRHLSVSVLGDGVAPGPEAVAMIADFFGIDRTQEADLQTERFSIKKMAINVIQPIPAGNIPETCKTLT